MKSYILVVLLASIALSFSAQAARTFSDYHGRQCSWIQTGVPPFYVSSTVDQGNRGFENLRDRQGNFTAAVLKNSILRTRKDANGNIFTTSNGQYEYVEVEIYGHQNTDRLENISNMKWRMLPRDLSLVGESGDRGFLAKESILFPRKPTRDELKDDPNTTTLNDILSMEEIVKNSVDYGFVFKQPVTLQAVQRDPYKGFGRRLKEQQLQLTKSDVANKFLVFSAGSYTYQGKQSSYYEAVKCCKGPECETLYLMKLLPIQVFGHSFKSDREIKDYHHQNQNTVYEALISAGSSTPGQGPTPLEIQGKVILQNLVPVQRDLVGAIKHVSDYNAKVEYAETLLGRGESMLEAVGLSTQTRRDQSPLKATAHIEITDYRSPKGSLSPFHLVEVKNMSEKYNTSPPINLGAYGLAKYRVGRDGSDTLMDPVAACGFIEGAKLFNKLCQGNGCQVQYGDMFDNYSDVHKGHWTGECVDVRPFKTDEYFNQSKEEASRGMRTTWSGHDEGRTLLFSQIMKAAGASVIIGLPRSLKQDYVGLRRATGVSSKLLINHIHHLNLCFWHKYTPSWLRPGGISKAAWKEPIAQSEYYDYHKKNLVKTCQNGISTYDVTQTMRRLGITPHESLRQNVHSR